LARKLTSLGESALGVTHCSVWSHRLVETQPGCRLSLKVDAMKLSDGQDFVTVK
jgi:hypothetical protein